MTIGERIRNRRKELKMTQDELGSLLGCTKSAICKVERDKEQNLTTDRVTAYAKALNCSVSYLMGWENNIPQFRSTDLFKDVLAYATENNIKLNDLMGGRDIQPCDYKNINNPRVFEVNYSHDKRLGLLNNKSLDFDDKTEKLLDLFTLATDKQKDEFLQLLSSIVSEDSV